MSGYGAQDSDLTNTLLCDAVNRVMEDRITDMIADGWGIEYAHLTDGQKRALREARIGPDDPIMQIVYRALDTDDAYDHVRFVVDSVVAAKGQ